MWPINYLHTGKECPLSGTWASRKNKTECILQDRTREKGWVLTFCPDCLIWYDTRSWNIQFQMPSEKPCWLHWWMPAAAGRFSFGYVSYSSKFHLSVLAIGQVNKSLKTRKDQPICWKCKNIRCKNSFAHYSTFPQSIAKCSCTE